MYLEQFLVGVSALRQVQHCLVTVVVDLADLGAVVIVRESTVVTRVMGVTMAISAS